MSKKSIHVVPNKNGWAVKKEGRADPISTHHKQKNAEDTGRSLAKRNETEIYIHGRDGRIRARNTYGPDPFPPKG